MKKDTRRLAAIMFTDMVGYTALMQENEQKARTDRDRHREVMVRLIGENQGSILQYFGDGTMCTFNSAIQAVKCALEIQTELQKEPKIPVRIGVHVGDIVYEGVDIYGDAVNVASRIEAISVPGGVLFSGKVFDDIKNHPELRSVSVGEFKFKNVKWPIRVYALNNPRLTVPTADDLKGKVPIAIRKVAVLPFVNMSSDPENEYFSDGMSEELIDAFTKVDGLQVTARTSSFAFKGKNVDIREIGAKLDVDTILEGSVRKAGNRVRITAQLIDTSNGGHLFSETYNRELEDIFAVQDEIAQKIARKLTHHIGGGKVNLSLVKSPTDNLEAYQVYLKGVYFFKKFGRGNLKKAIGLLEQAIEMEPSFAAAYSWLANSHTVLGAMGALSPGIAYPRAQDYARKALELDDNLHESHIALALVKLFYHWDRAGALRSVKRALELNPGAAETHHAYAMYLKSVGRLDEALEEQEHAVRLDPLSTPYHNHLAYIYYACERYDDALRQLDKIFEMEPSDRSAVNLKAWIVLMQGKTEEAIDMFKEWHEITGGELKGVTGLGYAYAKAGRTGEALQCLEKVKKRRDMDKTMELDMHFYILYTGLGDLDNAFYHLEKALDKRLGGIVYTGNDPALKELRNDPRYETLMAKTGLSG
ncbi:MAG: tetratricopeptide repeat protein [bacterium]|nr:tetratricopeptide repeat protein [bacterium]